MSAVTISLIIWSTMGLPIGLVAGAILFGKRELSFSAFKRIRDEGYNCGVDAAAQIVQECLSFDDSERKIAIRLATLIRKLRIHREA